MLYRIRNGKLQSCKKDETYNQQDVLVAVNRMDEEMELLSSLPEQVREEALQNRAIRYESREGADFFCFVDLEFPHQQLQMKHVQAFFGEHWIQFVCEDPKPLLTLLSVLMEGNYSNWSLGRLFSRLMEELSREDIKHLEYLEGRIALLEDEVMTGKKRTDYVKEIIRNRKHLMKLKRVYEQTVDLLEDLLRNENGFLDEPSLKYIKIYCDKMERLYDHVISLQEYVTEIRDAYQAQVDINLNVTMKFFTVITSIFLPLTLVAGWYGMNLKMPEYEWEWGYPIVIGVSLLLIIAEIIYFKKNKWF